MERTGEAAPGRIAREDPSLAADLAEVVIDPPDRTFDETRRPSRSAAARSSCATSAAATPTTTSSSIVPGADVAVRRRPGRERRDVPFFGDGYPLDWPATAARLVELVTGAVVPGHGDRGGRAFAVGRRPRVPRARRARPRASTTAR